MNKEQLRKVILQLLEEWMEKNRWTELTFCYDINGKVEKRDSGIDDINIYGGLNELNENIHLFGIIIKDYREQG